MEARAFSKFRRRKDSIQYLTEKIILNALWGRRAFLRPYWNDSSGYSGIECTRESPNRLRASFDCTKASTEIENLVCNDKNLSRLDHILFRTYRDAMRFQKTEAPLRRSQRQWLQKERDSCQDQSCLGRAYEKRIQQLRGFIPKVDSNQMGNY